jgi:NhaP-type Na+/H+ and K+/H+ antiporter
MGLVAGTIAAAVVVHGTTRKSIDDTWLQVVPVAGALLAFTLAEAIGGRASSPPSSAG